jgi:large conductance mechanosensitive channel
MYGEFLNALISFIIVAATIYFFVVLPINKMLARFKRNPEAPRKAEDVLLLEEIRDLLKQNNKKEVI